MKLQTGQIVYLGGNKGQVIARRGPHAYQVYTLRKWSVQDFATGKITPCEATVKQVWPIKSISLTAPEEK